MDRSPLYARRKPAGGGLSQNTPPPPRAAQRDPRGGAPANLRRERLLPRGRRGEDEQPGGLTAEPMDDEDPPASPCPHPVAEQAVRGALTLGFGRDRQEPCGLVDDDEVVVLVHEAERRGEAGGRR